MSGPNFRGPLPRLVLDGGASVLMLLCLAYWWLGNLAHEIFGTAVALVIVRHIANNANWWRALRRGRYDLRRLVGVVLTALLAVSMLALIGTGFAVSRSVLGFLPLPASFTLREIHMFSAHWAMVILGLHIGYNWHRVMTLLRGITRGALERPVWRWFLLAVAVALAAQGLRSAAVMDVWTRLRLDYSLVMWDFNDAAARFFGHWLAIVALFAVATHLLVRLLGGGALRTRSS